MCSVTQSCLTLCYPADCSLPDSSVMGILQAWILELVAMPSSRASSQPRDQTQISPHCRQILYHLSHQGSPRILMWVTYPFSRRSSLPNNWARVSFTGFLTSWATREVSIEVYFYSYYWHQYSCCCCCCYYY